MLKRYSYRAYPSAEQIALLARAFGAARWVYNMGIEAKKLYYKETGKNLPDSQLTKRLPLLKTQPETNWLSEVSSVVLQQSLRDLSSAYNNFFEGIKANRRVGEPKFKKRGGKQSVRVVGATTRAFKVKKINDKWAVVRLPKIGEVRFRLHRDLPNPPSSVTILLESDGTYHVSFVAETHNKKLPPMDREIGLDLGLNDFASIVSSDGTREKIQNPRYFATAQSKLAKAQKNLARKRKGSKNREKARLQVAKLHSALRRQRLDFLHKLTTRLINENQVLVTEGLSVKALARAGAKGKRGRGMRQSVHDVSWGMFLNLLSQKAQERQREHIKLDKFFPSTRLCSLCGTISGKKPLSVRSWSCDCDPITMLDRDYNAAVNILVAGGHSAYGEDVRRFLASC